MKNNMRTLNLQQGRGVGRGSPVQASSLTIFSDTTINTYIIYIHTNHVTANHVTACNC